MKQMIRTILCLSAVIFSSITVAGAVSGADVLTGGGYIRLSDDVQMRECITLDQDTVLDLNGHTVYGPDMGMADPANPSDEYSTILVAPGVSFSCWNGSFENVEIGNYGHILTLDSLTMRTSSISNRGVIDSIQRCRITSAGCCIFNYSDIHLIYDCDIKGGGNVIATSSDAIGSNYDPDGKVSIDVIRHCRLLGDRKAGFTRAYSGRRGLVENCILAGNRDSVHVYGGDLTTFRNCVIVSYDTYQSIAIRTVYKEDPAPRVENCTLIAELGHCGEYASLDGSDDGFVEHGELVNCVLLLRSDLRDLDPYLAWEMESKMPTADGLKNFGETAVYTPGQFTDVPAAHWGSANIQKAYELGLMKGASANAFDPDGNVTVAQTIAMAARLHSIYFTGSENFVQSGAWYQTYVDYCKSNGILKKEFADYNAPAKRSDFVAILAAALPTEALPAVNTVEEGAIPDVAMKDESSAAIYALYRAGILTGNDVQGSFGPDTSINRAAAAAIITRMADTSLRKSLTLTTTL